MKLSEQYPEMKRTCRYCGAEMELDDVVIVFGNRKDFYMLCPHCGSSCIIADYGIEDEWCYSGEDID